jgi:metal-responsive CopG/Arc/MetJ family transcriptional regulator
MNNAPQRITISVPAEMLARLDRIAAAEDRARSSVARRLLAAALDRIAAKEARTHAR